MIKDCGGGDAFLCTGNPTRSILGEVHPLAIEELDALGYSTENLASTDWDVFADSDAPLAVAAAISLFSFSTGAALATAVGVLVEVPVMLSVIWIVNRSKDWYERGVNQKPISETGKL